MGSVRAGGAVGVDVRNLAEQQQVVAQQQRHQGQQQVATVQRAAEHQTRAKHHQGEAEARGEQAEPGMAGHPGGIRQHQQQAGQPQGRQAGKQLRLAQQEELADQRAGQ